MKRKKANDVIGTAIEFSAEANDALGSTDFSNGIKFEDMESGTNALISL